MVKEVVKALLKGTRPVNSIECEDVRVAGCEGRSVWGREGVRARGCEGGRV